MYFQPIYFYFFNDTFLKKKCENGISATDVIFYGFYVIRVIMTDNTTVSTTWS